MSDNLPELKKPTYLQNQNPLDMECPVDPDDIKVPFIVIAQPLGSVMKEDDPGYIDGCKAGYFYNSSTRNVYGKSVKLQFIHYFKVFNVYKGTPQAPEWVEALSESDFEKLPNRQFVKDVGGVMTPGKPDMFIKENWRFVVALPDDDTFDFMFMTVKPGGIQEAKIWVNQMYEQFKKGTNVLSLVWDIPTFSKQSKTVSATSYQMDSSKIKPVGFVTEEAFNKAVRIRDQIKASIASHLSGGEEY